MEEEDFEGDNLANLVVTRTGDYSSDLTVNYLVSGTQRNRLSSAKWLCTDSAAITAEIVIQAVEDNDVEDEHVVVHISDSTLYNSHPNGFRVDQDIAPGTI